MKTIEDSKPHDTQGSRADFLTDYLGNNAFLHPGVSTQQLNQDLNKFAAEIGRKLGDEYQSSDSPEVVELLMEYRKVKREVAARAIFKPVA